MDENKEIRLKRMRFRAWHRGTKEADLLLGGFADRYLDKLSEQQLDEFDRMLEITEADLMRWVTGATPIPEKYDSVLFRQLISEGAGKR